MSRSIQKIPEQVCLPEEQEREVLSPPQKKETSQTPWFLSIGPSVTMVFPILMMSLLGSRISNGTGNNYRYVTLAAGVCSALLGVFWGITNRLASRREEQRSNRGKESSSTGNIWENRKSELQMLAQKGAGLWHRRSPAVPEYYAENRLLILNWNRVRSRSGFLVYTSWNRKTGFSCKAEASGGKGGFRKGFDGRGGRSLMEEVSVSGGGTGWCGLPGEFPAWCSRKKEKQLRDGVLQIFWQQVLHHCTGGNADGLQFFRFVHTLADRAFITV